MVLNQITDNLADYHPARIRKIDKIFEDQLDFEDKKHIDLLLTEKKDEKHYVLIKEFNAFMHDHTLNC